MIRSPMEICRERKWETASVTFAVIVVLAIPLCIALVGLCGHSAAEDWLRSYTPVVYLEPDASAEDAASIAREIGEWSLVEEATVRDPAGAHAALVERLGEDTVTELGITPAMLPTSILVRPSIPVAGHIDLVSRVSGLEARLEVDAVEVPSSEAMRVVNFAAIGIGVAGVMGGFGLLAAALLLLSFLERLRARDDESDRVLALFGAYDSQLRRPTLIRGVSLGAACGVVVAVLGCIGLLGWQLWAPHVLGIEISLPAAAWSVVGSPAIIVPLIGLLAAWFAVRPPVQIWRRGHV